MDWRSRGSCLLPGKNSTGCADTVSAVSGIRLPPECRFCWDCKRRKRFNAGVPGAVAPGKTNLWSPLPVGKGGGGMGAAAKAKGSVDRRQRRQALPFGTAVAGRAGNQPDKPPRKGTCMAGTTSAARVQPWGCKGRSPLHKITLISPFPLGRALCERGSGGWGKKRKVKAWSSGDHRTSPAGYRWRPTSQCRPGSSPGMQGAKPLA